MRHLRVQQERTLEVVAVEVAFLKILRLTVEKPLKCKKRKEKKRNKHHKTQPVCCKDPRYTAMHTLPTLKLLLMMYTFQLMELELLTSCLQF